MYHVMYFKTCYTTFSIFIRYLQASKDLRAGEVILRENPVAVGPMSCMKEPICFECLSMLPDIEQDFHYICSGCNVVTLCGFSCEVKM